MILQRKSHGKSINMCICKVRDYPDEVVAVLKNTHVSQTHVIDKCSQ